MKNKLLVFVLSFCLVAFSAPYYAEANSSGRGDCDSGCRKLKEAKVLGIVYGGILVIAVTAGAAYLLIRGDDSESELANWTHMVSGQKFRLVPYSSQSGGHSLDLEFRLNDNAKIGLRARYGPESSEALNRDDTSYIGGLFYQVRF